MTHSQQEPDLSKVAVKSINIVDKSHWDTKTTKAMIVGCPKESTLNQNPKQMLTNLLSMTDATINQCEFIYARNYYDITPYYELIEPNTIFIYLRFAHKRDTVSLQTCAKDEFNVSLLIKKLKIHSGNKEYRSWYTQHTQQRIQQSIATKIQSNININPARDQQNEIFVYDHDDEKEMEMEMESTQNEDEDEDEDESYTPPPTEYYDPPEPASDDDEYEMNQNKSRMSECMDIRHTKDLDLTEDDNSSELPILISTPNRNRYALTELLNMKLVQKNSIYIMDIPIMHSFPNILKSDRWFGQFGEIQKVRINDQIDSQFKSVIIIYHCDRSALEAISYCNANTFNRDEIKLSATYHTQKYCKWFLLQIGCKEDKCPHKHEWDKEHIERKSKPATRRLEPPPAKVVNAFYKNYGTYDEHKEKLRSKLRKLAEEEEHIALDKFHEYYRGYFNRNIRDFYHGKLSDLIKYFPNFWRIEFDDFKNKMWIFSKIYKYRRDSRNYGQDDDQKFYNDDVRSNTNRYIEEMDKKYQILQIKYEELQKEYEYLQNGVVPEDICKSKFEEWLVNIVKLPQYLSAFQDKQLDSNMMIEFLDQETIKEVNISSIIHQKLILKRAKEYRKQTEFFKQIVSKYDNLYSYESKLYEHGILILSDLNKVKTLKDVMEIFDGVGQQKAISLLQSIESITSCYTTSY